MIYRAGILLKPSIIPVLAFGMHEAKELRLNNGFLAHDTEPSAGNKRGRPERTRESHRLLWILRSGAVGKLPTVFLRTLPATKIPRVRDQKR